MQIIVLGMHRSGTSMVARLLNMMGAYFATEETAMPPTAANPKGYWEREDIRQLNDRIFSLLGMSWDNIIDFKSDLLTAAIQQQLEEPASKIIFSLESHRPWMAKDPRFCLLFSLWQPLLEVPIGVYVYRNPIQVAQSLKKREGFPLTLGIALWEKYNLCGLANGVNLPKILISHAELIRDPVGTVKKFYQDLLDCDVRGLRLPADKEIQAFIDAKLFHEQSNLYLYKDYLNPQQATLFEAFENGTVFQLNPLPNLSGGAAEVLQEYKNKLVATEERIRLHQEITHRDQTIINLNHTIDQRDTEINQYNAEISRCNTEISQRDIEISRRDEEIRQNVANITQYQTQLDNYHNLLAINENKASNLQQKINKINQQYHELEIHLNESKTILTEKEQSLAVLASQVEKQKHNIHHLLHWLKALDDDIKAIFNSLTWRAGNVITRIALTLMFKKASLTAQDHIEEIRQDINTWQQAENKNNLIPAISPSSPTKVTSLPKALSLVERDYQRWIKNYDTLTPKVIKRMQQRLHEWEYQPLISIVMPTYNTEEKWLRIAIDSVQQQIYPHWELCIADDASTQPHVRQVLEEYAQHDDRIKLLFRTENGHISAASNTALEMVSGELVAFLDHDDKLVRSALFWIAKAVLEHPDAMLWYSDEDKINENNQRFQPYFKSDWNPDLFLSHNLITHLAVYRTALIQQIGGFREGYEGAQDYDLALRAIEHLTPAQICHIPRVLYHWRMIDGSTAKDADEKPYAIIAAQKAIREHLARRNIEAQVMEAPDLPGTIRVQYALPSHLPLVSLIIPTRNNLELLHRCVESILNKTDYDPIEILIINNNSDDPATLTYLQQLEDNDQARIIDYSHPFNYADMNNRAVEYAQGEIIGLINNDIEVINPEWLSEMVSHLLRPEVGIVGAKLWYPNDTLQHAGVILGIGGVAGHPHKGLPRGNPGYFNRANLIQSLSAVTGACLIMQKSNFLAVGGLDAEHLAIAFNDIDLCLKMSERQLRVVWTPYAELYHHESASRGYEDTPEKIARFEKECLYMKKRWDNLLLADPAYNPNLTLETQDFALAWPPRVAILP